MDDDRLVIERVLSGRANDYRLLVDRYQRMVWTFVWNMLRHEADAEDLVQDVFVAAYRNLASYDVRRSQFSTWLLTIARNRCCTALARGESLVLNEDVAVTAFSPEHDLSDSEVWQQLDAALSRLPVEQRSAFVLAEIQELPYAEIAAIEGVEPGTVKSRVSRAKARLREMFRHDLSQKAERE